MQEAEKMSKELNFDGITQGIMDYQSVGSAKGTEKKKKVAKKVSKKKATDKGDDLPIIGISTQDDSTIKAPAKKAKKGKVVKKSSEDNVDDDFELFENEKKLDAEMMKDLNEQDIEDLKEIRALEKIASIRQSQGIEDGQDDLGDLVGSVPQEKKKPYRDIPYANSKQSFNDVSLDFDEDNLPIATDAPLTQTDFLSLTQIPGTNSLKLDLYLPTYELETVTMHAKQVFSIIFDFETIQKIS